MGTYLPPQPPGQPTFGRRTVAVAADGAVPTPPERPADPVEHAAPEQPDGAFPEEAAAGEQPVLAELTARNVLVAVDGSAEAWDAVALGIQLARTQHGRLTLASVVVPVPAWTQVALLAAAADEQVAERAAINHLREVADTVPPDVPITTVLLHGDAAQQIARRALEGRHDLVILGAREHGPIGAALESVSRRLMRCCRVPVLTVHVPMRRDGE